MPITSLCYIVLSVVSIFIFYLLNPKYRLLFLAILSSVFIASYSYVLLGYILIYSVINYYLGILIHVSRFKKALFRIGIIINLSQLLILRYASFAIDPIFEAINSTIVISKLSEIIVPLGISYFSLQAIGYLINIKMGWEKPEKCFLNFLLYIIFFPKFISGPVERSNHFLPQLKTAKEFDEERVAAGIRIMLFGLFKKIAIANQLAPFITNSYQNINSTEASYLWILVLLQPLYLYFDFSGYTDIAIGFSKTLGIDLLPNFNKPFFSENMSIFWKRFHISLSSWFNDYIFKQTSFKRRRWGVYASAYAVFLTFFMFGIWHGAGWNFMILGLLQALAINYEFFSRKWRIVLFSKMPAFLRTNLSRLITYCFYAGSLVFFFSPDIQTSLNLFSRLLPVTGSLSSILLVIRVIPLSAIILLVLYLLIEYLSCDFLAVYIKIKSFWEGGKFMNKLFRWSVYFTMISMLIVLGSEVQQFIYAQF